MIATQTDTKANIGVITLGRQKTTAAPLSTRRRGGGGEGGFSKKQKLNHDQKFEERERN